MHIECNRFNLDISRDWAKNSFVLGDTIFFNLDSLFNFFLKGTVDLLISFSILVLQTSTTVRATHAKMEARASTASTPTSAFVVTAGRAPSVKQVSGSSFSNGREAGREEKSLENNHGLHLLGSPSRYRRELGISIWIRRK